MATQDIRSISQVGTSEPFALQVSRGQITGHRLVTINGFNEDVDQDWETFWPEGGVRPLPASAIQMTVSSSSADDAAAGTGARTVSVFGLDADYNEISETVTLNGQTGVTTTNSYLRINDLRVITAGSGNTSAGIIYIGTGTITTGKPATVYELIPTAFNMSLSASYTVPAGYTGYITGARFTLAQSSGSQAVWGRLTFVNTNNIKYATAVAVANNGVVYLPQNAYPIRISEKTTISPETKGKANNNICSTFVQFVLVKNASV